MHTTTAKAGIPASKQATLIHLNGDASGDSSAIKILGIAIHQDQQGRYSLNDLHQAAGGENRHQPALFFRRPEITELLAEISNSTPAQNIVLRGRDDCIVRNFAGIFARRPGERCFAVPDGLIQCVKGVRNFCREFAVFR